MAKEKHSPGKELPLDQVVHRQRGSYIMYIQRGVRVAAKWPRKRPEKPTPAQKEQRDEFKRMVAAVKEQEAPEIDNARDIARNSKYTWRDVSVLFMVGRMVQLPNYEDFVPQYSLDALGNLPGMIVIRTEEQWIALARGDIDKVLTIDPVTLLPAWLTPAINAITELTGDVIAGPGIGDVAAELSTTGVTPGTYTLATIDVDAKGRIIDASAGEAAGAGTVAHPGFASGRYYTTELFAAPSTFTLTTNRLYAIPFFVGKAFTFTRMGAFITVTAAGSLELGVYSNLDGAPNTLIADAGSIAIPGNNLAANITGLNINLSPGWYWLALAANAAASIRSTPASQSGTFSTIGAPNAGTSTTSYNGCFGSWTFSAGMLPTSFPTPTFSATNIPLVFIGS
jgi:hypothetical protein